MTDDRVDEAKSEVEKLRAFARATNTNCQPAFDFEAFTDVANHPAFPALITALALAIDDYADVVFAFCKRYRIKVGFVGKANRQRLKTRRRHFRLFTAQLVALRRLGVVHGETRDNRGLGLFLLNSEAHRWAGVEGERALIAQLSAAGSSLWTTHGAAAVAEVDRFDLRSVVARPHRLGQPKSIALLYGPLSWLNHAPNSGVVLTTSRTSVLKRKFDDCKILFHAEGYDDRRELLIRYDSPDSATFAASAEERPWLADDVIQAIGDDNDNDGDNVYDDDEDYED